MAAPSPENHTLPPSYAGYPQGNAPQLNSPHGMHPGMPPPNMPQGTPPGSPPGMQQGFPQPADPRYSAPQPGYPHQPYPQGPGSHAPAPSVAMSQATGPGPMVGRAPHPGQIKLTSNSARVTCPACKQETNTIVQSDPCTVTNWALSVCCCLWCVFLIPATSKHTHSCSLCNSPCGESNVI